MNKRIISAVALIFAKPFDADHFKEEWGLKSRDKSWQEINKGKISKKQRRTQIKGSMNE